MKLVQILTLNAVLLWLGIPSAFAGQLVSVSGSQTFDAPPATGDVYNVYASDLELTDNAPVDIVFTVTQTDSAVDYFFAIDLATPSTAHSLIGLEIYLGFGTGADFVPADWAALQMSQPLLNFVEPSDHQDNHAIWSPALNVVFNEDEPIVPLYYILSIPDPDAAFIPASHQFHEANELVGYEFTIRHTAIYIPEPASSWLVLGLTGLSLSRPAGRWRSRYCD